MHIRRRLAVPAIVLALLVCGPAQAAPADPGGACEPFTDPARAARVLATDRSLLQDWFAATGTEAAWPLFDAYLTPGRATAHRTTVTDPAVRRAFATDPTTRAAARRLLAQVPVPEPTGVTTRVTVPADLGRRVRLSWHDATNYPGVLAGGVSGTRSAAGRYDDRRDLRGSYRLEIDVDPQGVRRGMSLVADLRLTVRDAVDFCPGATGRLPLLTGLSRLERTPTADGGTWTRPQLFALSADLDPVRRDLPLEGNDADGDGRPDRQPWRGAGYPLDPCPDDPAPSCR